MRTVTKWMERSALIMLVGSAVVSCGDDSDDGGVASGGTSSGGVSSGGKVGSGGTDPKGGSGGALPSGGSSATGGKSAGGQGGSAGVPDPGAGGAPDAGAGGEPEPGSGGVPSEAGSDAGGAAGEIGMAGAGGAIDAGGAAGAGGGPEPVEGIHIYVGCDSSSGNIRSFAFDRDVGEMTPLGSINVGSPLSAAVLHPDEDWLYVSHATQGRITTFARDPVTGSLDEQDSVTVPYDPALGAGGAGGEDDNPETRALAVDSTGSYLAAANTAADTVVAFELDDDGLIGALAGFDSAGTAPRDVLFNTTDEFVVV